MVGSNLSLSSRKTITTLAFSPDGKYVVTGEVSVTPPHPPPDPSLIPDPLMGLRPSRPAERSHAGGSSLGC